MLHPPDSIRAILLDMICGIVSLLFFRRGIAVMILGRSGGIRPGLNCKAHPNPRKKWGASGLAI